MQKQYIIASDVTDGRQIGEVPPLAIQMWKPGRHLKWYFSFCIPLVFSRLLFFCVSRIIFRWFRVLAWLSTSGFTIVSHFSSECWPVGPFWLSFPPWLKALVTPLITAMENKNAKRRIFSNVLREYLISHEKIGHVLRAGPSRRGAQCKT